ncbi:MAG: hypothetical protein H0U19_03475, partial [Acidobacteria bacterium]|nr:hypothetical protein [Acidobacteriota bacterium]
MMKQLHKVPALSVLTAALLLVGVGATTPTPQTRGTNAASSKGQARPMPFPVAELFFELNDSAGDLGIHSNIDGGPWT